VEGKTSAEPHGEASAQLAREAARLQAECAAASDTLAAVRSECCAERERAVEAERRVKKAEAELSELQAELLKLSAQKQRAEGGGAELTELQAVIFELSAQEQRAEEDATRLARQGASLSPANLEACEQLAQLRAELLRCQQDIASAEDHLAKMARDEADMRERVGTLRDIKVPRHERELQEVQERTLSLQSMETAAREELRRLEAATEAAQAGLVKFEEAALTMELRAAEACCEVELVAQRAAGEAARLEALEESIAAAELDAAAAAARLHELEQLKAFMERAAGGDGLSGALLKEGVLAATEESSEGAVAGLRGETSRWEKIEQELPAVLASFESLLAEQQAPCMQEPAGISAARDGHKADQSAALGAIPPSALLRAGSDAVCRMSMALEQSQQTALHMECAHLQEQVLEQQRRLMWQAHELSQLEVAQQANSRLLATVDELSTKLGCATSSHDASSLVAPPDNAQGPPATSTGATKHQSGCGLIASNQEEQRVLEIERPTKGAEVAGDPGALEARLSELMQECVQLREGREHFLQELMEHRDSVSELRSELALCRAELAQKESELARLQTGPLQGEGSAVQPILAARDEHLSGAAAERGSPYLPLQGVPPAVRIALATNATASMRVRRAVSVSNSLSKERSGSVGTTSASGEVAALQAELQECREELMHLTAEAAAKQETLCAMWSLCRQAEAQSRAVLAEIRSASAADALVAAAAAERRPARELGTVWQMQRMLTAVRRRLVAAETQRGRLQARLTQTTLRLEEALATRDAAAAENAALREMYVGVQGRVAAMEAAEAEAEVARWGATATDEAVGASGGGEERLSAEALVQGQQRAAQGVEAVGALQGVRGSVAPARAAGSRQLSQRQEADVGMSLCAAHCPWSAQEHDLPLAATAAAEPKRSMPLTQNRMLAPKARQAHSSAPLEATAPVCDSAARLSSADLVMPAPSEMPHPSALDTASQLPRSSSSSSAGAWQQRSGLQHMRQQSLVLLMRASAAERSSTVADAVARAARARVDTLAAETRRAEGQARGYRQRAEELAEALQSVQVAQAQAQARIEAACLRADVLERERDTARMQVEQLKLKGTRAREGPDHVAKAAQTDSSCGGPTADQRGTCVRRLHDGENYAAQRGPKLGESGERALRETSIVARTNADCEPQEHSRGCQSNALALQAMAALLAAAQEVCATKKLTTAFRRAVSSATVTMAEQSKPQATHSCEARLAAANAALAAAERAVREASDENEAVRAAAVALHTSLCEALAAWERRPRGRRGHRSAPPPAERPAVSHVDGAGEKQAAAKDAGGLGAPSCARRADNMWEVLAALCELSAHAAATRGRGSGAFGAVDKVLANAPSGVQEAAAASKARAARCCDSIAEAAHLVDGIRLALSSNRFDNVAGAEWQTGAVKHAEMERQPAARPMSAAHAMHCALPSVKQAGMDGRSAARLASAVDVAEESLASTLARARTLQRPLSAGSAQFAVTQTKTEAERLPTRLVSALDAAEELMAGTLERARPMDRPLSADSAQFKRRVRGQRRKSIGWSRDAGVVACRVHMARTALQRSLDEVRARVAIKVQSAPKRLLSQV
jgi:hypothetical protein